MWTRESRIERERRMGGVGGERRTGRVEKQGKGAGQGHDGNEKGEKKKRGEVKRERKFAAEDDGSHTHSLSKSPSMMNL